MLLRKSYFWFTRHDSGNGLGPGGLDSRDPLKGIGYLGVEFQTTGAPNHQFFHQLNDADVATSFGEPPVRFSDAKDGNFTSQF